MGCKRILVSNKYYPTFNRSNVELVTDKIREITEDSIITQDGQTRGIDCLIYGTGFITDPRVYLKNFPCIGQHNQSLAKAWEDGAESYYGVSTKGFPNLFQLLGPNTVLAHNSVLFMIESQIEHILQLIQLVEKLILRQSLLKLKYRINLIIESKTCLKVQSGSLAALAGISKMAAKTFPYGLLTLGDTG